MTPYTIAAIDLGGTKIAGALVNYQTKGAAPVITERYALPTDAREGGDAVMGRVISVAQHLCALAEAAGTGPVSGVGIAAAGCINPADGSVLYANGVMPGWTGQPLASAVRDATGVPAAALGDVHGHALGEARWGAAKGLESCLVVAAGTGLGGAFVLNGQVIRGAHGAAGHIGHMVHPAAAGHTCNCGGAAHTECVTSGLGIGALYQGVSITDPAFDYSIDGAEVSRRAVAGEEHARRTLHDSGYALGEACGSWANMLDPAAIVLTGTVTNAGELWRQGVKEGFDAHALVPLRSVPFLSAALGSDAPLVGAAEFLLDTLN